VKSSPFHSWLDRMSALRCRAAVLRANGNQREAARLIGIDRTTMFKVLKRDNAVLDARAAAENWQPDLADPG
jgi:transcriptional regulator with AAA-type ATPase domain